MHLHQKHYNDIILATSNKYLTLKQKKEAIKKAASPIVKTLDVTLRRNVAVFNSS